MRTTINTTSTTTRTTTNRTQGSTTMTERTDRPARPQHQGLFADPGAIAPSVDRAWRDDFIVELRLLSVPGDRIGDALMTVETHVAESGESAQEAFGDAKAYAREVAEGSGDVGRGWTVNALTVAGSLLGLVGMLATVRAFTGWLEGATVTLTAGDLAALGLLMAMVLATLAAASAVLRFLVEHRWVAFVLPVLLIGAFVSVFVLFQQPVTEVSHVVVGVVGAVGLLASIVLSWLDVPERQDEITAPGEAAGRGTGTRVGTALVLPLLTGLLLLMTWGMSALA